MMVEWILCIGGNVNDEMIICENKNSETSVVHVVVHKQHTVHSYPANQWFVLVVADSDMV